MSANEIFDSIFAKNNVATMELVNDAIQQRAYEMIQQRKVELGQTLFNQAVSEDDE
jgi:hypothetical protein